MRHQLLNRMISKLEPRPRPTSQSTTPSRVEPAATDHSSFLSTASTSNEHDRLIASCGDRKDTEERLRKLQREEAS